MLNWDFGIFNPDRIYPVTPGPGLSEVNAVAIVSTNPVPKRPASKSRRCLNQDLEAWEAVTPPRADRTALNRRMVGRESRNGVNPQLVAPSTAMPYQKLARIESGFVDLH
jgi:hypothetical protein